MDEAAVATAEEEAEEFALQAWRDPRAPANGSGCAAGEDVEAKAIGFIFFFLFEKQKRKKESSSRKKKSANRRIQRWGEGKVAEIRGEEEKEGRGVFFYFFVEKIVLVGAGCYRRCNRLFIGLSVISHDRHEISQCVRLCIVSSGRRLCRKKALGGFWLVK